jgi:fatty acid CoA ligase FadD9
MSSDTREQRLQRRISHLYGTDQQFADARPNDSITHAIESPELGLSQIVRAVIDGYADRPALAT